MPDTRPRAFVTETALAENAGVRLASFDDRLTAAALSRQLVVLGTAGT